MSSSAGRGGSARRPLARLLAVTPRLLRTRWSLPKESGHAVTPRIHNKSRMRSKPTHVLSIASTSSMPSDPAASCNVAAAAIPAAHKWQVGGWSAHSGASDLLEPASSAAQSASSIDDSSPAAPHTTSRRLSPRPTLAWFSPPASAVRCRSARLTLWSEVGKSRTAEAHLTEHEARGISLSAHRWVPGFEWRSATGLGGRSQ